MSETSVAVIGAGVCGVTCAAALAAAGHRVVVYDKGRGLGGRLATRRRDGMQWDHGAQHLTAKTDSFARWLSSLPVWRASGQSDWHVGEPSQNALVKRLADGLDVRLGTRIQSVARTRDAWSLATEDGPLDARFSAVAITAPAPQTAALLPPGLSVDGLDAVRMQPCWTLMVGTERPLAGPPYMNTPHPDVAWLAADHTKPGREGAAGQYVLQAGAQWSRQHLELDAEDVTERLLEHFRALLDCDVRVTFATAHRWRYALTEQPLGRPCYYDGRHRLGVAGDWCLGRRAEHAFLSGSALAEQMLAQLNAEPSVHEATR
jgi:predicted NAD/FAD-dependent oxidoreductase